MQMEIYVPTEHIDQLLITVDTDYGDPCSIGWKQFVAVGQFKYKWAIEHLSHDDLVRLRDVLNYAISITGEGPE